MFLQVLGGLFLALVFCAIASWIICMAIKLNRNEDDVEILDKRVANLEAILISQLKCKKKKLEVEKKMAVCKLKIK